MAATGSVLLAQEQTAELRPSAHDLEEIGANGACDDRLRVAAAGKRELSEPIDRDPLEEPRVALPVVEVCRRDGKPLQSRERALRWNVKQPHEPARFVERQRTQQHGVDDAENGGVGADADREDGHDRDQKRRRANEHPERVAKVGGERAQHGISRQWILSDQ